MSDHTDNPSLYLRRSRW